MTAQLFMSNGESDVLSLKKLSLFFFFFNPIVVKHVSIALVTLIKFKPAK